MENCILGYDCNENIIEQFSILRAIWSNDIDIEELEDADPREYCAVIADDGNAYAISVHDNWYSDLIRKRENILNDENIKTIVKPISEMINYELAMTQGANGLEYRYYDFDHQELKNKLNKILKEKQKVLIKK